VKSLCRVAAVAAALMALAVGALAFVGASAGAQEYTPRCVVAVIYNQETGILRVIGTGLQAGFTTPILLDGEEIGEATADGAGDFLIEIAVQLDGPVNRIFVVSIQCSGDGDVSTTQLTAPPATTTTTPGGTTTTTPGGSTTTTTPTSSGALSRTGTESVPLAVAGVTAVGLGSLAVLFARRRRHDTA
jgi:LPXTG-motif cell wall-anchored protein